MSAYLKKLEKSPAFWFFIGSTVLFFFLRLPSLFEPYWYGDEGIYQTIALALTKGRTLYTEIWDNKPPLLYMTYALVQGNQFLIRLLSLLAGLGALTAFFLLAQKMFSSKRSVILSTIAFTLLFGLPTFEGNIANAENFMLVFILASGYLIFSQRKEGLNNRHLLIAGLLLGIAFLFKIVAVFDFAAFFIFLVITRLPNKLSFVTVRTFLNHVGRALLVYVSGFITPFLISVIYFSLKGALGEYIHATFFSTVGYVGYNNQLFIPQGLLIAKLLLLIIFSVFVLLNRKRFSQAIIFISLWTAFALFSSLFSQRPYTHYLLMLIPSFSLLVGLIYSVKKKYSYMVLAIAFGIALFSLDFFNHWSFTKTITYYTNYMSFVTGKKTLAAYESFFDRRTPRDTELVRYINSHSKDSPSLFIWGNNAQIYYQTKTLPAGRFTVAYHVQGNKNYENETLTALTKNPPRFVITMTNMPPSPYALYNYSHVLSVEGATIYERVD